MKTLRAKQYWVFILSAFLWLAIDLGSKWYVKITTCCSAVFVHDWFFLTEQKNRGIAFGIPLDFALQIFISSLVLIAIMYIGFRYLLPEKRNSLLNQIILGIIIGGGLGNLINRVALGYVIDFIALKPFPVFNIADIGITVGLITLFCFNLKTKN